MSDQHDNETSFTAPTIEELAELFPGHSDFSFIAQGGMGAVYYAVQNSLDREVALKILPKELAQDEEFREQFQAEAKAMAKLNHPTLIAIYDFGQAGDYLFISMEFVKGKALHYSIYGKKIEPETAANLTTAICDGLFEAHEAGILHRDIKPGNILLDEKARPKIGDFGLATGAGDGDDGPIYGTPGYSPPEVTENPTAVDHRSDIFSAGVMLYEMLTGKIPAENPAEYVKPSKASGCSKAFDDVIAKATHLDPEKRYDSAQLFGKDVQQALEAPAPSLASGGALNVAGGARSAARATTSSSAPPLKNSGGGLFKSLILIAALAAACWGAWLMLGTKKENNALKEQQRQEESQRLREKEKQRAQKQFQAKKAAAKKQAALNSTTLSSNTEGATNPETIHLGTTTVDPELKGKQEALFNGDFSQIPESATKIGSSFIYLCKIPMSWDQASLFAQRHGGSLATIWEQNKKRKLADLLKEGEHAWIGLGQSANSTWEFTNGKPLKENLTLSGEGNVATLDNQANIHKKYSGEKQRFLIEWTKDPNQKSTLVHTLQRFKDTLGDPTPNYPPGSFHFQDSHYFVIPYKISYKQAEAMARSYNGTLLHAESQEEQDYIKTILPKVLSPNNTAWSIGGVLIRNSSPLQLDNSMSKNKNHPFIIEWTPASLAETIVKNIDFEDLKIPVKKVLITEKNMPDELRKLREIAKKKIIEAVAKRNLDFQESGKNYQFRINTWFKDLKGAEQEAYQKNTAAILGHLNEKNMLKPSKINAQIPQKLVPVIAKTRISQQEAQRTMEQAIEHLRLAYIKKLNEYIQEMENSGRKKDADLLRIAVSNQKSKALFFTNHVKGLRFNPLKKQGR